MGWERFLSRREVLGEMFATDGFGRERILYSYLLSALGMGCVRTGVFSLSYVYTHARTHAHHCLEERQGNVSK